MKQSPYFLEPAVQVGRTVERYLHKYSVRRLGCEREVQLGWHPWGGRDCCWEKVVREDVCEVRGQAMKMSQLWLHT